MYIRRHIHIQVYFFNEKSVFNVWYPHPLHQVYCLIALILEDLS